MLETERKRYIARFGSDEGFGDDPTWNLGPYYGALAYANPELAWHCQELGRLARTAALRGSMPDWVREWVDVVVDWECKANGTLFTHMPDFVAVGGRVEAIEAVMNRHYDQLTDEECKLTTLIQQVCRLELSTESYEWASETYGTKTAIELIWFAAFLNYVIRFTNTSRGVNVTWDDVTGLIRSLKEGTFELPEPTAGAA
jgi:hypothetical protein